MSTITTIPSAINASKSVIDTNFSNLNIDKLEATDLKTVNGNSLLGSGDIVISGGSGTLDGLTDVAIVTPTTGQALVYDGTQWENTTLPGGGDALTTNPLSQFASTTSLQLKNTISDETGSGALVFATSPTLVTPALGTPASGTLTNCIDLPLAGLVDINTNRILGRSTAGTGAVEEINVTAIPTLIGLGTSDSPQFAGVNVGHATDTTISRVSAGVIAVEGTVINGYATTATAAGTTTLTVASPTTQFFTGSTTQTIVLPTTSILAGQTYRIKNNSTGTITVQSSGANTIQILGAGMNAIFTAVVATPTTAANWSCALEDSTGVNIATTATANAATINLAYKTNTITNNSAATLTITLPTAGAIDGEMRIVRVLDFSAVAQTIAWVNTENGEGTAPILSNGSTTLPRAAGFMYNSATSKWRCLTN